MNRARRVGTVGLMLGLVLAIGCRDPRDMEIEALREARLQCENEKARLQQENDELRSRIAIIIQERDGAQRRIAELEQQVRDWMARANQPAPQPTQQPTVDDGWNRSGPYAWRDVSEEILFDSGKADIKASGRSTLQSVVADINSKFPNMAIWVIGHTDSDPIKRTRDKWTDNLDLSVNRGAAVTRALWELGLDRTILIAGGQGEFNPKAPNDTRANKALNRRVQIVAVPRPGAAMIEAGASVAVSSAP